jgi:hypothetical protein
MHALPRLLPFPPPSEQKTLGNLLGYVLKGDDSGVTCTLLPGAAWYRIPPWPAGSRQALQLASPCREPSAAAC